MGLLVFRVGVFGFGVFFLGLVCFGVGWVCLSVVGWVFWVGVMMCFFIVVRVVCSWCLRFAFGFG